MFKTEKSLFLSGYSLIVDGAVIVNWAIVQKWAEGSVADLTYPTGLKDVCYCEQKSFMCVQNKEKLIFAVLETLSRNTVFSEK